MVVELIFRVRSLFGIDALILKLLKLSKVWFAMRYRRWWIIGTVASMGQKR